MRNDKTKTENESHILLYNITKPKAGRMQFFIFPGSVICIYKCIRKLIFLHCLK